MMQLLALQSFAAGLINRFRKEEDGLALTEYLILLALLTAAVVAAVIAYGQGLGANWQGWATWVSGLASQPAS